MALDSTKVKVGVSGAVYFGPTTVTAPATLAAAVPSGMFDVGYISEDGITESLSRSVENIKAWQGAAIVRVVVTESGATFSFTMIETNKYSQELFYGAAPDASGVVDVDPSANGGRRAFLIDVVDGTTPMRYWIPSGEVTEAGEVTIGSGEPIGYEVTLAAYPATSLSGKSYRKFTGTLGQ